MKSETSDPDFSDYQPKYRGPQQKQPAQDKAKEDDDIKLNKFEKNLPFQIKSQSQLNVIQRTIWTIILLFALFILILAGHVYIGLFAFVIIIGMFHEIISLKRVKEKDVQVPFFGALNWYFFFVGIFFAYGKLFTNKLTQFLSHNHFLLLIAQYHAFAGFMLWIIGFLFFVLSLKQGFYRYQFRQFGWTHFTILFIITSSAAILHNLFEGMIWMLLPALLVISNDTCAYIFGKLFGKTQLISLSPKKTWEGFIGGFISTVFIAIIVSTYFSQFDYLICPQTDLVFTPFQSLSCTTPAVFLKQSYQLPSLFKFIGYSEIWISKFQLHSIVWSFFASFVAPFGGFFASGFKRAIKIKDFADTIPGHGGFTDRMDCQILTGMFCYLYLHSIILTTYSVQSIVSFIVGLSDEQQSQLYQILQNILIDKQLVNKDTLRINN